MSESTKTKPAGWFVPVAGVAVAWNLIGVAAYIDQKMMNLSALPDAQRVFYETIPAWATAAFAIAVFAGVAGSVGLVMKKRWALPVLIVSCLGIVVQMMHSLVLSNGLEVFGSAGLVVPSMTLVIGVALIGVAALAKNKGWI